VEREIIFTGIGGQGVQLAGQVLARAAVLEGRQAMLLGTYGGTMRGGRTEATLVIADSPIVSPPIVSRAWAAIGLHDTYWEATAAKLRPGGLALVNSSLFRDAPDRERHDVVELPATRIATEAGAPVGAALVLLGAHAALTGAVALDSLEAAMRASLPPYRAQHADANGAALRAGFQAAPSGTHPAWSAPLPPAAAAGVGAGR
jgi:Pyruvate/2-oxoacid:ferredoxin oxidoreductase gamma subunit